MSNIALNVPFADNDRVRALGCHWSRESRCWYADWRRCLMPHQRELADYVDVCEARRQAEAHAVIRADIYRLIRAWSYTIPCAPDWTDLADGRRVSANIHGHVDAVMRALRSDAGLAKVEELARQSFFYIGDSDCMDVLDRDIAWLRETAAKLRALDLIVP